MSYFYSKENNSFYPDSLRQDYENGEGWPTDAIEISDELYLSLVNRADSSQDIVPGENGLPILVKRKVEWSEVAESFRQQLLTEANEFINEKQWPSKLTLGRLSDTDKTTFNLWLDYLDNLAPESLDLSNVVDEKSYNAIIWPDMPEK